MDFCKRADSAGEAGACRPKNGPHHSNLQGFHPHKTPLTASCFREINAPTSKGAFLLDVLQLLHANARVGTPFWYPLALV
jgi:hypothetical protein